ncbi:hypothetical protein [Streptomyces sp. S.PB5]|uniref:hypothetical protein n=1 Tax=Streptomyces sp. S.PB5 TaxID=3020844 RepID=UPI0025AF0349|nr:hypothetical protein [Streptomyces sp. S.PB5]
MIATLAVYFPLSIAASVRARVRSTDRNGRNGLAGGREGRRRGWGRWLLTMPHTIVVFLTSLSLAVWDRARAPKKDHRASRRRRTGATAEPLSRLTTGWAGPCPRCCS